MKVASGTTRFFMAQINAIRTRFLSHPLSVVLFPVSLYLQEGLFSWWPMTAPSLHPTMPMKLHVLTQVPKLSLTSLAVHVSVLNLPGAHMATEISD